MTQSLFVRDVTSARELLSTGLCNGHGAGQMRNKMHGKVGHWREDVRNGILEIHKDTSRLLLLRITHLPFQRESSLLR